MPRLREEGAETIIVPDISNYTMATPASAFKSAGVKKVVIQVVDPSPPYPSGVYQQQIQDAAAFGLEIEVYGYYWWGAGPDQMRAWMDMIRPYKYLIKRFWIDVEDTLPFSGNREADLIAATQTCEYPVGIYTAKWVWDAQLPGCASFRMLPLWVAQYDGGENLDFTPFGGWTEAYRKQYIGTTTFAGVSGVDLNYEAEETEIDTTPVVNMDEINTLLEAFKAATTNNSLKMESINGSDNKKFVITLP